VERNVPRQIPHAPIQGNGDRRSPSPTQMAPLRRLEGPAPYPVIVRGPDCRSPCSRAGVVRAGPYDRQHDSVGVSSSVGPWLAAEMHAFPPLNLENPPSNTGHGLLVGPSSRVTGRQRSDPSMVERMRGVCHGSLMAINVMVRHVGRDRRRAAGSGMPSTSGLSAWDQRGPLGGQSLVS
jgi:hypothetical protein